MDRWWAQQSRFIRPFSLLLRSLYEIGQKGEVGSRRLSLKCDKSQFDSPRLFSCPSIIFSFHKRIVVPLVVNNYRNYKMSPINQTEVETADVAVDAKKMKVAEDKENRLALDNSKLYFVKLSETAQVPTRGSKLAAGYDLKSAYKVTVPARGSALVKTDIQIQLPSGTYGRVAPRSGLALKNKIDVGAGVIDEDYRGNVGVILFNHGDVDFQIDVGDRIAQLICEKIAYPDAVEVESLEDSERGAGGFGSTGTKN